MSEHSDLQAENESLRAELAHERAGGGLTDEDIRRIEHPDEFAADDRTQAQKERELSAGDKDKPATDQERELERRRELAGGGMSTAQADHERELEHRRERELESRRERELGPDDEPAGSTGPVTPAARTGAEPSLADAGLPPSHEPEHDDQSPSPALEPSPEAGSGSGHESLADRARSIGRSLFGDGS